MVLISTAKRRMQIKVVPRCLRQWQLSGSWSSGLMIFVVAQTLALVVMQSTLLQNGSSALRRVWYYLNTPVMIGNVPVSVTSLALGVTVFVLTLIAARSFSSLLER